MMKPDYAGGNGNESNWNTFGMFLAATRLARCIRRHVSLCLRDEQWKAGGGTRKNSGIRLPDGRVRAGVLSGRTESGGKQAVFRTASGNLPAGMSVFIGTQLERTVDTVRLGDCCIRNLSAWRTARCDARHADSNQT